jgi:hypothetical protein
MKNTLCTRDPNIETEDARRSQVAEQLGLLQQEVSDNTMIIEDLEMRLAQVLRSQKQVPESTESGNVPEEMLVPLADEIRGIFRKERSNNNRLRSILHSIEL